MAFHAGTRVQADRPTWVGAGRAGRRRRPRTLRPACWTRSPQLTASGIFRYLRLQPLHERLGRNAEARLAALLAEGPRLVNAGGRVLTLVGARRHAGRSPHAAPTTPSSRVSFDGMQYRRDIGLLDRAHLARQPVGRRASLV